ncbi:transglutaminase TgpA family protein [Halalkalibacter krulwichiae]|uniref:Protein-glutamine gamma-glutamyltransferase n=1 Tax=Halalkalibacter krulwichiae TaxID=199441 RepID=A0A1X9MAU2_9BACI|nr:transglutaminaseTgpA domain-containing protein [Halalkalibacter krulwichiae]ARK28691.1 Protein-glutamine gamma-glutamyltransferase [Halalkalibacter krulwichiae]
MRLSNKQITSGRDFLLYGLSFLLLMEWLFPLPYVTDTGYIHVFVLLSAVFFFITFLQLPVLVSVLFKLMVIYYGLYLVFFTGPFFSFELFNLIATDIVSNIGLMLSGGWHELSDLFRSLLFYVLLSIMSYLLYYWTVHARRILFFLVFTIIYVTVIDTFTIYDATFSIIRTFIVGFLLLGLVTAYRMIEQNPTYSMPKLMPVRLAALLVIMIGAGGILGLLSPKLDPQWDDPVPFMRAAVGFDEEGAGDLQRIGYGENDDRLGGGFVDDDTPVFYAAASKEHYWRGETKDFYTGKGWETNTPVERKDSMWYFDSSVVYFEQLETELAFVNEEESILFNHLFYPGELPPVDLIANANVFHDAYTDKVSTYRGADLVKLSTYSYEYFYPSYDIEGLRSINERDPEQINQYYTQLPETLPDRVGELALEITDGLENRYDQARAIESFFGQGDFRYETQDVPVPSEGQDYVDQFLFETQRGYCDNFSTSMVVLLRTLDIPARWVKGFTSGEVIESISDTKDVYEVTNGNAHSWVEVYFPEVGWVPFEPTRGFDNNVEFIEPEVEVDEVDHESAEREEEEPEVEDAFAEIEDEENQSSNSELSFSRDWGIPGGPWILFGMLAVIFLLILLKNKKIVQYYMLARFLRRNDDRAFTEAYNRLLWLLQYVGLKRADGETLRAYAERIDKHFSTTEMMSLTVEYEKIMYGGYSTKECWLNQKGNWAKIVRKIAS